MQAHVVFAALYQFPLEYKGNGQRIAILEFGRGYRGQDLDAYFANLGLPPNVTSRSVDGGINSPKKLSLPTLEVNLDVDVIGSLAPNAAIVVFFANNNQKGFIDAFAQAVHGADFRPTVISISWGGSEKHWHPSSITAINTLLEDASTLRISVCASAGDWGSSDHHSGLNVIFPASSPYALACGGTMISVSDGVLVDESVWHDKYGVTGGGVRVVCPTELAERDWRASSERQARRPWPGYSGYRGQCGS